MVMPAIVRRRYTAVKKLFDARPSWKRIVGLLAVPALLIAGYAGIQLAPMAHATTSGNAQHGQFVIECPSSGAHC
jgi:hypothetical protein